MYSPIIPRNNNVIELKNTVIDNNVKKPVLGSLFTKLLYIEKAKKTMDTKIPINPKNVAILRGFMEN